MRSTVRPRRGGHECELDVVAFAPKTRRVVHIEPSVLNRGRCEQCVTRGNSKQAAGDLPSRQMAEQQQIDHSLTSLDDLIAMQILKCEVLKTHKVGLMQQLFPTPASG